jgi:hypothetical protein
MLRAQLERRRKETVDLHSSVAFFLCCKDWELIWNRKCDALESRLAELKAEIASLNSEGMSASASGDVAMVG